MNALSDISKPKFSIITATYGRSKHILPSIQSVLKQNFDSFELLIIGDGVDDDTFEFCQNLDPRIRIYNLENNSGSQSSPNNYGIQIAHGQCIAYLGHDDLWMPDHLSSLNQIFENTLCDVAVSGCAFHGPPGTNLLEVTGIFDHSQAALNHFFPPSSLAHKKSIIDEIGGWANPRDAVAAVDVDLLLRLATHGYQFASTNKLTTHKFAAGHRYLSYLLPSSSEQKAMLEKIENGEISSKTCVDMLEQAVLKKTFMHILYEDYSQLSPGLSYYRSRQRKGLETPQLQKLERFEHIPVIDDGSLQLGLDWYAPEFDPVNKTYFRWSGPSLRPKILIPFTSDQLTIITLYLLDPFSLLNEITVQLNFMQIEFSRSINAEGVQELCFIAPLKENSFSVLELIFSKSVCPVENNLNADTRELGIIFQGFTVQLLKERVAQIAILENQIVHSNHERDQAISLYKETRVKLDRVISEKEAFLNSTSWKVTKPFRKLKDWLLTKTK